MMTGVADDLSQRLAELRALPADSFSEAFAVWTRKTRIDLCSALGIDDYHVTEFDHIHFLSLVGPSSPADDRESFEFGRTQAAALLKGVLYLLQTTRPSVDYSPVDSIDSELAERVANPLRDKDWVTLLSATVIFVEDTVRKWAQLPDGTSGDDLWTKVLSPERGKFPLGKLKGEKEGWHRLGMGFGLALRNVNTHRIDKRPDLKTYALGVLGTASLLLTELRFEHGSEIAKVMQKTQSKIICENVGPWTPTPRQDQ